MIHPTPPIDRLDAPLHVWPQLASDQRLQAIRLMAQLACHLAAAHPVPPPPEAPDALPPHQH